jgi:hypothetical protein
MTKTEGGFRPLSLLGNKVLKRILAKTTVFLFASLMPFAAYADNTIGSRISALVQDAWNPIFLLVAVGAALAGIIMFAKGFMKIAAASSQSAQSNSKDWVPGLAYIAIAAALIALPDAAGIGMTSILGAARGGGELNQAGLDYNENGTSGDFLASINGALAGVRPVDNCLTSDAPAACMAQNIALNVVPIAVYALFAMVFISGLLIFAMTLIDIAKSAEDPRSHGRGGLTKLFTAVLLMNAPLAFSLVSKTVLGVDGAIGETGLGSTSSNILTYTSGSSLAIVKKYAELISHLFVILTFFGAWSFIRGVFMIKGTIEGRSQGSLGMAFTYMVAGVLLANAKVSTCYVLNTVGGADLSAGFCTI